MLRHLHTPILCSVIHPLASIPPCPKTKLVKCCHVICINIHRESTQLTSAATLFYADFVRLLIHPLASIPPCPKTKLVKCCLCVMYSQVQAICSGVYSPPILLYGCFLHPQMMFNQCGPHALTFLPHPWPVGSRTVLDWFIFLSWVLVHPQMMLNQCGPHALTFLPHPWPVGSRTVLD